MGRIDLPDKTTGNVIVSREYLDGLHDTIEQLTSQLTWSRGFDTIDLYANDAPDNPETLPFRRIQPKRRARGYSRLLRRIAA